MVKSDNFRAILAVMFFALILQIQFGESQTCPGSLTNLTTCLPFVASGAPNPNAECCAAIKAVDINCVCTTTKIATQLPAKCNLQPISCPTSSN